MDPVRCSSDSFRCRPAASCSSPRVAEQRTATRHRIHGPVLFHSPHTIYSPPHILSDHHSMLISRPHRTHTQTDQYPFFPFAPSFPTLFSNLCRNMATCMAAPARTSRGSRSITYCTLAYVKRTNMARTGTERSSAFLRRGDMKTGCTKFQPAGLVPVASGNGKCGKA